MKFLLMILLAFAVSHAELTPDELSHPGCLTYGDTSTIRLVLHHSASPTGHLTLHYASSNWMQISSPFSAYPGDTLRVLVAVPAWLDSAGKKSYPPFVSIQSEDGSGMVYGALRACMELKDPIPPSVIARTSGVRKRFIGLYGILPDLLGRVR